MKIKLPENDFRTNLTRYLVIVAIVATFANIPLFYVLNQPFSYFLMAYDFSYILIFVFIKKDIFSHETHANLILFVFFIHMLSIPVMNDSSTMVVAWVALYPIVAFTIKGAKDALLISLAFLSTLLLFFVYSLLDESYSFMNIATLGMMNLVLSTILYLIIKVLEAKERES